MIQRHLDCAISEKCQTRTGVRSAGSSSSPSSWLSSISSITSALASATSSLTGRLVFTELTKGCWNTEHTWKDYSEFFITVQNYSTVHNNNMHTFTQKWKFCHHLLTLKFFQTCMSFFLLLNSKEDILKNVGNQTVDGRKKKNTMEVNGFRQLFDYQHSSK